MRAILQPGKLRGTVAAIPSKSYAHRLLICAALADGPTEITCPSISEDIRATADCLNRLGADIRYRNGVFRVRPIEAPTKQPELSCGESGTTLRFLLPVVCALGTGGSLTGRGRLADRPLSPLYEELEAHGAELSPQGVFPLTTGGRLRSGDYTIAADVSSQFIGGLLFALPLLEGDSTLHLTGKIESRPYLFMTLEVLTLFGAVVREGEDGRTFSIPGGQKFHSPGQMTVEGDWSNAAFWLAAGACGGDVTVTGLRPSSCQGDKVILDVLERFGAAVWWEPNGGARVIGKSLFGCTIDASDIPDLVPALAVTAARAKGETVFTHAQRLRLKESDRIQTVTTLLKSLGGEVRETEDGLIVRGGKGLSGGQADSSNDHRIAMAAAVAATLCAGSVTISGAQAVNKSYPNFFADYNALGGVVEETPDPPEGG